MIPKSLAMIKMEKNFRAHNEKGYHRQPYLHYNMSFWIYRIEQELNNELKPDKDRYDYENMREELADLSNLIDYAFERTFIEEEDFEEQQTNLELDGLEQLFKNNKKLEEDGE